MKIDIESDMDTNLLPKLRKYEIDMRKGQRAVLKEAADETLGHFKNAFRNEHSVSGNTAARIRRKPGNRGWSQKIEGPSVIDYVDEGTAPHPVDPKWLESAAAQYGMRPEDLASYIRTFGTQPHNVTDDIETKIEQEAENIIERVLKRKNLI